MPSNWKTAVIDSFDSAAPRYDAHCDIQRRAAETLVGLAPENVQKVLEIGCGTGALTKLLADKYAGATILATDISPAMVEQARANADADNIKFAMMDGEHPNTDQTYDLIISNMAFQWFEDLPAALEKLKTCLNPGGQILYSMPGSDSFPEWRAVLSDLGYDLGLLPFDAVRIKQEDLHITYASGLEFLKSLKAVGAHQAAPNYKRLNAGQLRRALGEFDKRYGGKVSWHILYNAITNG